MINDWVKEAEYKDQKYTVNGQQVTLVRLEKMTAERGTCLSRATISNRVCRMGMSLMQALTRKITYTLHIKHRGDVGHTSVGDINSWNGSD